MSQCNHKDPSKRKAGGFESGPEVKGAGVRSDLRRGTQMVSRSWKRILPWDLLKESPCQHLDLSPVRLIWRLLASRTVREHMCVATRFRVICYSSHSKLIQMGLDKKLPQAQDWAMGSAALCSPAPMPAQDRLGIRNLRLLSRCDPAWHVFKGPLWPCGIKEAPATSFLLDGHRVSCRTSEL